MRRILSSVIGLTFATCIVGCTAVSSPSVPQATAQNSTPEGLVRVENTRFDEVYVRPGFDLLSFDSVILAPSSIAYKSERPDNELTDRQLELMTRYFDDALEATFAQGYRLVAVPSVRTLRIVAGIVDLEVNVPTELSGIRRNRVFTVSSGEMTLNAEVFDAHSGQVLVRVVDREAPRGYWHEVTRVSEWAEVRQAFSYWSDIAKHRIDALSAMSR